MLLCWDKHIDDRNQIKVLIWWDIVPPDTTSQAENHRVIASQEMNIIKSEKAKIFILGKTFFSLVAIRLYLPLTIKLWPNTHKCLDTLRRWWATEGGTKLQFHSWVHHKGSKPDQLTAIYGRNGKTLLIIRLDFWNLIRILKHFEHQ